MKITDFREMVNRTRFITLIDKKNPYRGERKPYHGVYLEKSEGKLVMATTDNRRLAFTSFYAGDVFPDFNGIIVPPALVQRIAKRKRDTALSISVSGQKIHFHIGSVCISEDLIPGEFVRFPRDPNEAPLSFTVNRLSLIEALGRVLIMTEDWRPVVNIDVSLGVLALYTDETEYGSAQEEISCDYSGEKMTLIFNAKYLREILEHTDSEDVTFRFTDKISTVTILPKPELNYHFFIAQRRKN